MPKTHIVRQGEHLAGIADRYGFQDYRTLWDHPENAALKQKRQNPNVLFAGDRLVIPDNRDREERCDTGRRHRFEARIEKLMLRFTLLDIDGRPIASEACELKVEGKVYHLKTDAEGRIDAEIAKTAKAGTLKVRDMEIPVHIGHLDPVEEEPGARERLTNLGYYRGPQEPVDEPEFSSAVEEFQCDKGLKVTGACDAATQAKLKEAHGS